MNFLAALLAVSWAATPMSVTMKNPAGETVGTATLFPLAKGVRIKLDMKGLTPGEHALHFHEKAQCVGPNFDSAGGHFAGATMVHGFDDPKGHHAGDMPNIIAGPDGTARLETINQAVTLTDKGANGLLKNGASLIVHEKADDYKSQPAGNAGARIACGEIKK